jgi:hypothetical protein
VSAIAKRHDGTRRHATGPRRDAGYYFRICHLRDATFRAHGDIGTRDAVPQRTGDECRRQTEILAQTLVCDHRRCRSTRTEARGACGNRGRRAWMRVTVVIAVETRGIRP